MRRASLGWRIEGLNFPGHFVIRLHGDRQAVILDPFAGGLARSIQDLRQLLKAQSTDKTEVKPEHFSALENRQILLRLQNNIKVRRIQEGDLKGAERALQRMLWIAPNQAELWRESGILNARLENILAARRALDALSRAGRERPATPTRRPAAAGAGAAAALGSTDFVRSLLSVMAGRRPGRPACTDATAKLGSPGLVTALLPGDDGRGARATRVAPPR